LFAISFVGTSCRMVMANGQNSSAVTTANMHWLHSDISTFDQARAEHRCVLLDLEAIWCHWCHVMDEETYANPDVRAEIAAHFIALRIDQDARPDLADRYRDHGWPATVVFAADGSEIVKRQGFIEPQPFLKLLQAIVADPSPETVAKVDTSASGPRPGSLDATTRAELIKRYHDTYDARLGGLDIAQKYLDRDSVEYAIDRALEGDNAEAAKARQTLDAAQALIDPVWGGVDQYSTYGDWKHPHYEKLATVQAQYLRIYALAYAAFGRKSDARVVRQIRQYLDTFLRSPQGAFYTSQDADLKPGQHATAYFTLNDARRRALGIPHVDKHIYALQNGQIIEALATWAELHGDSSALAEARQAALWITAHRALANGGFGHGENDTAGPYLGDTLAMGRAFLALYRATAQREWLARSSAAADFIEANFARKQGGYVGAKPTGPITATPRIEENISLARFTNLLAHYTGKATQRATSESAMRWLASPETALSEITDPGILLADDELHGEPLHLTVTGSMSDPVARQLFVAMQHLPQWYKRIDWWDKTQGPLPNPDVRYPSPKRAAAFVCTQSRCSLPMFTPEAITEFVKSSHTAK
ncbi:MAG TPA: DUF255 domain-containing protein, partial [Rudaea sp.]|nr:DUF255 domain-containing protein [Rudaea sp.]